MARALAVCVEIASVDAVGVYVVAADKGGDGGVVCVDVAAVDVLDVDAVRVYVLTVDVVCMEVAAVLILSLPFYFRMPGLNPSTN